MSAYSNEQLSLSSSESCYVKQQDAMRRQNAEQYPSSKGERTEKMREMNRMTP